MTRLSWAFMAACGMAPVAVCGCSGRPHVIVDGAEDNFRAPRKPARPGPRLLGAVRYAGNGFRGFDQDGEDLLFRTSMLLPPRKICSATFEIRVRRRATGGRSFEFNDFLRIGFAPFADLGERKLLFQSGMWAGDPPGLTAKTARIPLPAVELNRFVLLTRAPHYLDVVLHDDTAVDYVKLILRFE